LNLGLLWDGIPHTYEANNNMSNFYPNLYNPANAAVFATDPLTGNTNFNLISPYSPGLGTSPVPALQGIPFYLNGIGIQGKNGIPKGLVNDTWDASVLASDSLSMSLETARRYCAAASAPCTNAFKATICITPPLTVHSTST
jgi:hypothetical protein